MKHFWVRQGCVYSSRAWKTFFSADDSNLKNAEKSGTKSKREANDFSLRSNRQQHFKALPGSSEFNSFSLSLLHHIANKNFIAQLSCCWSFKNACTQHTFYSAPSWPSWKREGIKSEREERDPKMRLRSTHELSEKEEKESNWY